ncbi:hypothetical protein Lal_00041211 [Lupinus albus]|nr:hypothetical protein Lal_00041211 [Lupinus albus]
MLKALAAPLRGKPPNGWHSSFTAWTTRVSNPVCSPRFRASASVSDQLAAFATGVLANIYEFHLYTRSFHPRLKRPPTRPLRPVIPSNASPLRITAAAGTKLAGAYSSGTVIIESGPCLSPSVADHPLRPATDRRLGRPLPHQLANQTRADLPAVNLSPKRAYPVLAQVSLSYSEPEGTFPRVTHPSAADPERPARLACVKPAASVRSEPGSNSHVKRD